MPTKVELTPHTGRRAWATYQAENGVPLPILSKMLGHKQLETTAQYYWRNVYSANESEQVQLTAQTAILNSVKDKRYWREYNAQRAEYLKKKNKERYLRNKNKQKRTELNINTTKPTTYAQQLTNPFKSMAPPKSRLEISR